MNDSERVQEWLHSYTLLQTDEAKVALLIQLKRERDSGSKVANEALVKIVEKWLK